MRCGDSYTDRRPRGCRLPLGHKGPCDMKIHALQFHQYRMSERAKEGDPLDDPSEERLAYMAARDDELRREGEEL